MEPPSTRALIRPGLTLDVHRCRGICVITVRGTLDRATAATLRTALIDAMGTVGPRLVLDLLAVHTCDEAGMAVIASAAVRARRRGGWLRLASVPAPVAALQARPPGGPPPYATVADAIAGRERPRRWAGRPTLTSERAGRA